MYTGLSLIEQELNKAESKLRHLYDDSDDVIKNEEFLTQSKVEEFVNAIGKAEKEVKELRVEAHAERCNRLSLIKQELEESEEKLQRLYDDMTNEEFSQSELFLNLLEKIDKEEENIKLLRAEFRVELKKVQEIENGWE